MSHTEVTQSRSRSLTDRGRLYELELQQSKRNKLERKIRKQISKMEFLLIDDQEEELSSEFSILNQLFEEYLSCHAKCQILIMSDEERQEDDHSTDSLDRKVFSIKRRIFDVLHSQK